MKQENNPLYTLKTVKHDGGNIKVWGAMSWHGIGPQIKIDGNFINRSAKVYYKT